MQNIFKGIAIIYTLAAIMLFSSINIRSTFAEIQAIPGNIEQSINRIYGR